MRMGAPSTKKKRRDETPHVAVQGPGHVGSPNPTARTHEVRRPEGREVRVGQKRAPSTLLFEDDGDIKHDVTIVSITGDGDAASPSSADLVSTGSYHTAPTLKKAEFERGTPPKKRQQHQHQQRQPIIIMTKPSESGRSSSNLVPTTKKFNLPSNVTEPGLQADGINTSNNGANNDVPISSTYENNLTHINQGANPAPDVFPAVCANGEKERPADAFLDDDCLFSFLDDILHGVEDKDFSGDLFSMPNLDDSSTLFIQQLQNSLEKVGIKSGMISSGGVGRQKRSSLLIPGLSGGQSVEVREMLIALHEEFRSQVKHHPNHTWSVASKEEEASPGRSTIFITSPERTDAGVPNEEDLKKLEVYWRYCGVASTKEQ